MGSKGSKVATAVTKSVSTAGAAAPANLAAAAPAPPAATLVAEARPRDVVDDGEASFRVEYAETLKLAAASITTRPSARGPVNTASASRPLPRRGGSSAAMKKDPEDSAAAILAMIEQTEGFKKYYQKLD